MLKLIRKFSKSESSDNIENSPQFQKNASTGPTLNSKSIFAQPIKILLERHQNKNSELNYQHGNTKNIPLSLKLFVREIEKEETGEVDFSHIERADIPVIWNLMKSFLREIPEGIVPKIYFHSLIDAGESIENLKKAIKGIEQPYLDNLIFVLLFLIRVSKKSESNKMNINNLAIVFSQNIFRLPSEDFTSVGGSSDRYLVESTQITRLLQIFLENFWDLFQEFISGSEQLKNFYQVADELKTTSDTKKHSMLTGTSVHSRASTMESSFWTSVISTPELLSQPSPTPSQNVLINSMVHTAVSKVLFDDPEGVSENGNLDISRLSSGSEDEESEITSKFNENICDSEKSTTLPNRIMVSPTKSNFSDFSSDISLSPTSTAPTVGNIRGTHQSVLDELKSALKRRRSPSLESTVKEKEEFEGNHNTKIKTTEESPESECVIEKNINSVHRVDDQLNVKLSRVENEKAEVKLTENNLVDSKDSENDKILGSLSNNDNVHHPQLVSLTKNRPKRPGNQNSKVKVLKINTNTKENPIQSYNTIENFKLIQKTALSPTTLNASTLHFDPSSPIDKPTQFESDTHYTQNLNSPSVATDKQLSSIENLNAANFNSTNSSKLASSPKTGATLQNNMNTVNNVSTLQSSPTSSVLPSKTKIPKLKKRLSGTSTSSGNDEEPIITLKESAGSHSIYQSSRIPTSQQKKNTSFSNHEAYQGGNVFEKETAIVNESFIKVYNIADKADTFPRAKNHKLNLQTSFQQTNEKLVNIETRVKKTYGKAAQNSNDLLTPVTPITPFKKIPNSSNSLVDEQPASSATEIIMKKKSHNMKNNSDAVTPGKNDKQMLKQGDMMQNDNLIAGNENEEEEILKDGAESLIKFSSAKSPTSKKAVVLTTTTNIPNSELYILKTSSPGLNTPIASSISNKNQASRRKVSLASSDSTVDEGVKDKIARSFDKTSPTSNSSSKKNYNSPVSPKMGEKIKVQHVSETSKTSKNVGTNINSLKLSIPEVSLNNVSEGDLDEIKQKCKILYEKIKSARSKVEIEGEIVYDDRQQSANVAASSLPPPSPADISPLTPALLVKKVSIKSKIEKDTKKEADENSIQNINSSSLTPCQLSLRKLKRLKILDDREKFRNVEDLSFKDLFEESDRLKKELTKLKEIYTAESPITGEKPKIHAPKAEKEILRLLHQRFNSINQLKQHKQHDEAASATNTNFTEDFSENSVVSENVMATLEEKELIKKKLKNMKVEKKKVQRSLTTFQDNFIKKNGRPVQTLEDREPIKEEYRLYKDIKMEISELERQLL
ncbi:Rho GTPase-activating protein 9 [Clydaea vesicula]|uniref:Rho GTPase-activating protein 9 n=1 Tax=Clydaea vesicula TaxID=447962 RepID=A0AAD5U9H1_9FUNG|nr:Rho GTPase-activating protein 9 [Clydaea vesicula]